MYSSIEQMVKDAAERMATDIHLMAGVPAKIRVNSRIVNLDENPLSEGDAEHFAREMAGRRFEEVEDIGEIDIAATISGRRCRINIYRASGTYASSVRILPMEIPPLDSLGLPDILQEVPKYNKGIVLLTGETSSGKSTTLAAILDMINHSRSEHIITLEDPIEYIYRPDKCIISQREIGSDTRSYDDGLRAVLREDPDIILIGEMRDIVSIDIALMAAETGHLVFATVHTNSAVDTIDRIVGSYPADRFNQIRIQLAATLRMIVTQQLLERKDGSGLVPAAEVMAVTPAIQNLIREAKTAQMQSALLTGVSEGSLPMDNSIIDLYRHGLISSATALGAARDRDYVKRSIDMRSAHKR